MVLKGRKPCPSITILRIPTGFYPRPCKEIAVSVVVDPAEAVLALRSGGGSGSVLHHVAGAELVQEPGGPAHLGEILGRGHRDENEGHCQDSHSW